MLVITGKSSDGFADWVGAIATQARDERQFVSSATPDELRAFTAGMDSREPGTSLIRLPATIALPTALPDFPADPAVYFEAYRNQARAIDTAGVNVDTVIARVSSESADAARSDVWTYGGVAVFAMLLTLLLIWFVTRAVVRPVRKLTAAARDMSDRRLPQLVESLRNGGDVSLIEPVIVEVEFGRRDRRARTRVQRRRGSDDAGRAGAVTACSARAWATCSSTSPAATRACWSASSSCSTSWSATSTTLAPSTRCSSSTTWRPGCGATPRASSCLSGAEQPRQWQQPIALVDVVRAAAAEIADFPRVELLGVDQVLAVVGTCGRRPRPPPCRAARERDLVLAAGRRRRRVGRADRARLRPRDRGPGIGLPPERLAASNELLRHPPVVGLALSRALGLHVVGLLAARHGIAVALRPGSPRGTVAMVMLPHEILEDTPAPEPLVPVPDTPPEVMPLTSRRTGA